VNNLADVLTIVLVTFMAGSLLDMGLRLDPRDAFRGLYRDGTGGASSFRERALDHE
jgi:hypothetical protein